MLNLTVEFAIAQGRLRRILEEKYGLVASGREVLEEQHGLEAPVAASVWMSSVEA